MAYQTDASDPRIASLMEEDRIGNLGLANSLAGDIDGQLDVFVDSATDPAGVMVVGPWVRLYARDTAALRRLAPAIPGNTGDEICEAAFAGVAGWVRSVLAESRALAWETPCWLYYLEPEAARWALLTDAEQTEAVIAHESGRHHEAEVSGLRPTDAPLVNEHWDLGGGSAEDYLRHRILSGPSSAAFVDGDPVSWSLTHDDGQMGVMFTLPQFRRHGYGRLVTRHLVSQILSADGIPFLYIKHENARAQKMAESMGFVRWGDYRWFGLGSAL
jgi:ribosomal protein S18 acetylase RimI-like enzyme